MDENSVIVYIDSDEVVFPFGEIILKILRQEFSSIEIPILKEWYLENNFHDEKIRNIIRQIYSQRGFFKTRQIVKGAKEAIENISKVHNTFILTSPANFNIWSFEDKMDWWKYYFGKKFAHERLIISRDKTLLRKGMEKGIIIDDNPKVISGLLSSELDRIVYDRPWNTHLKLPRLDWESDYMKVIKEVLK